MLKKTEMTDGSLFKGIILFSLPLMLSNVLQVLFNMSDVAVVGRFAGSDALGSVGSCSMLVILFTGLVIGMGSGVNALAARYIGAGDGIKLNKTVQTSLFICFFYGLLIMSLGVGFSRIILQIMKTKEDLLKDAVLYIRVYLLGIPALAIFNYGNGILSAAGDTKRPLIYLFVAGIANVILNLFFVIVCNIGVLGVALASVISQGLSAVLILFRLIRSKENYSIKKKYFSIDKKIAHLVLAFGIPTGLQNAIFAVANLFIQSAVNSFDTIMVEGNSAAANSDALIYDMMAAFYTACTSFMAQNYGAGKKERIIKSFWISILYAFMFSAVLSAMLLIFGEQFLSLFTKDDVVVEAGMKRLKIMACSYCFSAFMDGAIAGSRGLGKTIIPTIIVVMGSCVFRIIWIYTIFAHFHTIPSLYLLYIFSWSITAAFELTYFFLMYKKIIKEDSETRMS